MKQFLTNTLLGVIISLVLIAILSIIISALFTLLIWGGGYIILNDLNHHKIIGETIKASSITLWTIINIGLFGIGIAILFTSIASSLANPKSSKNEQ